MKPGSTINIKTTKSDDNQIVAASIEARKPHYYGERKSIQRENSASYIFKRGIYMLKDKHKMYGDVIKHPYMVLQADDEFIDKIGITTLTITKSPIVIDMIPIIDRGCLCYINPHESYYFSIKDFDRQSEEDKSIFSSTFHSFLEDDEVFELICDFWDMRGGRGLNKTKSEFISNYLNYLYKFKERLCRKMNDGSIKFICEDTELKFKTSYDPDFVLIDSDDDKDKIEESKEDTIDDIEKNNEDTEDTDESKVSPKIVDGNSEKETIEINLTDPDILTEIENIENAQPGEVKLTRFVSKMSVKEIKTFFTILNVKGHEMAALMYNTTLGTIGNKKRQLNELYNIDYI